MKESILCPPCFARYYNMAFEAEGGEESCPPVVNIDCVHFLREGLYLSGLQYKTIASLWGGELSHT